MIACDHYCNETGGGGKVEGFWRVCGEHDLLLLGGVTALLWEDCDHWVIVVILEVPVASLFLSGSGRREWQQLKAEHVDCPRCKHTTFVPAGCNFYILECWIVWKWCFLASEGIFFLGTVSFTCTSFYLSLIQPILWRTTCPLWIQSWTLNKAALLVMMTWGEATRCGETKSRWRFLFQDIFQLP